MLSPDPNCDGRLMTAQQSRPGDRTQAAVGAFGGADPSVASRAGHSGRHTGCVRVSLRGRWLTDEQIGRRIMQAANCPPGARVVLEVRAGLPVPLALDYLRVRAYCEVVSDDPATVGRWVRSLREGVARWVSQ